ncbi:hypothetical protein [Pelagicoccus sp. SDUM812002]|nr:hypothetical protein [Pelagicoccus sp. SDUM812002]
MQLTPGQFAGSGAREIWTRALGLQEPEVIAGQGLHGLANAYND